MKTYIIRAIKYFLSLIILLAVIFALMLYSGTSAQGSMAEILNSSKGHLLILLLIALSAAYPYFGYVTRKIKCEVDRERLIKFFEMCGYRLADSTEAGYLIFRANSAVKIIKTMGEDKILVSFDEGQITMQGLRKEVVKLEYRLITFLKNNEN